MIRRELKLISGENCLSATFPSSGILFQCVDADGYSLRSEPHGTVVSAFILAGKDVLLAENGHGSVPGISVTRFSKSGEVALGLCTYKMCLSRKLARPSNRVMAIIGAVCLAIIVGVLMRSFIKVEEGRDSDRVVSPAAVEQRASTKDRVEVKRFDLLLKHDEGQGGVSFEKAVAQVDASSEVDSRAAFQLYENGLALLEAGEYSEALDMLARAKDAADKLPIVPPYIKMIDEAASRARAAKREEQLEAVAEIRSYIDRASKVSPGESLKIIGEARAKLISMPVSYHDLLKSASEELDKLHRLSISTLLAQAHTLERLEGCRAADGAYRETLEKYGPADGILEQEIRDALDRCGGAR